MNDDYYAWNGALWNERTIKGMNAKQCADCIAMLKHIEYLPSVNLKLTERYHERKFRR